MELETESLLQKWLKMQIWQFRLALISRLLVILTLIISLWLTIVYLVPLVQKQMQTIQSLVGQISNVSEAGKKQEDLLKNFQQGLPGNSAEVK